MGQVTVRVNGYSHTIGCKDGEESHVFELVSQIENKTKLIRSMGGMFSEARMLLHVALLLADEASDLRAEISRLSAGGAASGPQADPRLAERLTRIAERMEGLAGALEAEGGPGVHPPEAAVVPPTLAPGDDSPAAGRG